MTLFYIVAIDRARGPISAPRNRGNVTWKRKDFHETETIDHSFFFLFFFDLYSLRYPSSDIA